MIELQPSASLGTLRVIVFGRGDREYREKVLTYHKTGQVLYDHATDTRLA